MKKSKIKTLLLLSSVCSMLFASVPVYATEAADEPVDNIEEEISDGDYIGFDNSFYVPKDRFQSSYEYDEYCKRMYKEGYMDVNKNWTPAAQDFINNPTQGELNQLTEDRKELIQERIDNGDMLPEENPFLTYDEREAIIKDREAGKLPSPSGFTEEELHEYQSSETNEEQLEKEAQEDFEQELEKEQEELLKQEAEINDAEAKAKEKEEKDKGVWGIISKIIIAAGIAAIILIGYYIYKRQF